MLLALCFLAVHFAVHGKSNPERLTMLSTYPSLDEFYACYLGNVSIFSSGLNVRRYFHLDSRKRLTFSGDFPNHLRGQVVSLEVVCGPPVQQMNFRLVTPEKTTTRKFRKRSARMEKVLEVSESSTGVLLRLAGEENELYHFLEPVPEVLEMDPILGQVSLRRGQTLDFETTPEMTFTVAITRIDEPSFYEIQSVKLVIIDENDEKPQFLNVPHPFLAVVSSNSSHGTSVFQLIARDEDGMSEVNYFAESGEVRFEVDLQSGVVRTRGNDPFPPGKEFELGVFAADVAATPPQKTPTESLKILVGTRPPQFHQSLYEAFVPESSEERHEIIKVTAHSHSLNPVSYELSQNGDQSSDFAIDQTTGTVDLLRRLDFDTGPHKFVLLVKAIDHSRPPLTSTIELVVNLLDVNDNPPTFPLSQYVIQDVPEDAPVGTKIMAVTASDLDSGENSRLIYVVDDDRFSLEHINNTAIIKIDKPLDYDLTESHTYSFVITAIDHGSPPLTGSANVRVSVKNVNDLQPTFIHSVEYVQVSEDASLGAVIHVLQAYDVDGDMVTYGFSDGTTTFGPFSISPDSGIITLFQVPDKRISSYQLNVSVHDDGSCCGGENSLSSTGLVVVEIKDVNNNAPKFLECSSYNPVVMERENIGTFVIKVTATDLDKGINSNLTYSLVRFGEQSSFDRFEIDPKTGVIVTADVLDRESKIGVTDYGLTVKAEDHGSPSLAGFCSFRIKVGDKNDNPPIFSMLEYWVSVEESSPIGKKVKQVYATDRDAGKNSMVEYFIKNDSLGAGLFHLHPATGWLEVVGSLFGQRKVVLDIIARDMGEPPKSSEAKMVVEVLAKVVDMPQWMEDYSKSTIFVDENVPVNHPVKRFKAVSSLNTSTPPVDLLLNYFIAPGENPEQNGPPITFYHRHDELTNEMILLTYRTLDYETIPRYTLTIKAVSRAMHSRHVDMQVVVEVKDSNDEIPQFVGLDENGRYSCSVAENLKPGVEVIQVTATDKDEFEDFKMITYEIKPQGEDYKKFSINSTSGTITTLYSFDREAKNEYYLTLLAKDGAPSSRSNHYPPGTPNQGEAELQIRILDVNDNAPYFQEQEYKARIPENADVGTVVIIVTAEDKDEENILTYSITSGNHGRVFEVVPETGEVKVRGHLDYETGPKEYKLTYRVFDEKLANTTVIVIEVIDINDNAPVFEQSVYTVENEPEEDRSVSRKNPKLLLTVRATDVDSPFPRRASGSHIRYGLTGQFTEDNTFIINEITGQIYLTTSLDRDPPQGRPVWNFNVLAYDESLTGYAEVKVHLSDVNDNPPVFDPSRLNGKVPEHSPPGHRVMTVMTSDNDSGLNASVTYSLRRVPRLSNVPIFSINHQTGLIVTMVDDLDREKVAEYQFIVVATDRGTPPLSATSTVTVSIEDINDHIPTFEKKFYFVEIQENLQAGSSVVSLSAVDMDIGINARLFYSLQVPEDRQYFTITNIEATNSGVIRVHKEVDFESLPDKWFNLTVRVEDIDSSHFDLSYVHVKILDNNDNPPLISPIHHKIDVHENVSIGTQLFKFSASDPDTESGGIFRFYIDKKSDPENMFRVSIDGVVRTFNYLDREKKPEHRIHIMCIDEGFPRLTSFATLVVSLIDINDHAPHIITSVLPVVYENLPAGQLVTEVTPEDLDAPHNGPPFKIWLPCSGDCPCPDSPSCSLFDFKFIPDGGKNKHGSALISSSKPLNREASKYHLLPIVLSDSGSPPMFGTSTLTICVGDVNDNLHRSAHKTIFALTSSGQYEDVPLGMAFAEDPDDWDVVDKTFTFVEEEAHELFRLNSTTGQIFSRGKLKAGSYKLLVRIYDVQWKHEVISTVQVDVSFLSFSALRNRASVRLHGTTSVGFIRKNPSIKDGPVSFLERFCRLFSNLLGVPREEVFVISLKDRGSNGVDVVFALHGVHRSSPEKLHGIVALRRREIEKTLGLRVSMSPIDECQDVNDQCLSSGCHTISKVGGATNLVDANSTSFVGLDVQLEARCSCSSMPLQLQEVKSCFKLCLNGGRCVDKAGFLGCSCPEGFNGPRCQLNIKSFSGNGWAWLKPFSLCSKYHISVEILTNEEQGTILYQGPLIFDSGESEGQSFLVMRLEDGLPVVEVVLEGVEYVLRLETNAGSVLDGSWHRIDLYLTVESIQLVLDKCLFLNTSPAGGNKMQSCETNVYLDYDSRPVSISFGLNPLQVGGVYSTLTPPHKGFNGCIRNLVFNDELYDMYVSPLVGMQQNVKDVCKEGHDLCKVGRPLECSRHSCGVLFQGELLCQCPPGWEGRNCSAGSSALDMGKDSYVEWELSDEIHSTFMTSVFRLSTNFHLMFRTRQPSGMLFRVNNNHKSKFISAELVNHHLVAVFNFNGWKKQLSLPHVNVSDGAWHSVTLTRERSWLEVKLDWGEGVYVNSSFSLDIKTSQFVIGRFGLVAGGNVKKPSFLDAPLVESDFRNGCLKDIRINGHHLPMKLWESNKVASMVPGGEQVSEGCHDVDMCSSATCSAPLDCVSLWRHAECACLRGRLTSDGKRCDPGGPECTTDGESCDSVSCEDDPCICDINDSCQSVTEELAASKTTKLLLFVFLSIVFFILLALSVLLTFHVKSKKNKKHLSDDLNQYADARENIVHYDEEGVGERDERNYSISQLNCPRPEDRKTYRVERSIQPGPTMFYDPGGESCSDLGQTLGDYLARKLQKVDNDPNSPPFESVREYCYEGQGSLSGSFSSLGSEERSMEQEESI